MRFTINLVEEEQFQLETANVVVTDGGTIEFRLKGTITDIGSDTLERVGERELRPIAVTFETAA